MLLWAPQAILIRHINLRQIYHVCQWHVEAKINQPNTIQAVLAVSDVLDLLRWLVSLLRHRRHLFLNNTYFHGVNRSPKTITRLKNFKKNILSSTFTAFTRTDKATAAAICTLHQKANLWSAKILPLNIPCRISANTFPLSAIIDYAATFKSNPPHKSLPSVITNVPLFPPSIPLATVTTATPSVAVPLASRSMTDVNQIGAPAIDQTWAQHKDASMKAGCKRAHIFFYWSSNNATCIIYRYQSNGWPNPCALGISLIDCLANATIPSALIISSFESSAFS